MPDSIKRVSTGDPLRISADWFNSVGELLRRRVPTPGQPATTQTAPAFTLVRVDSDLTGGGYYLGKFTAQANAAVDTGSTLAESQWMTSAFLGDCVIVNWLEQGETTHLLTATITGASTNNVFPAMLCGYAKSGDTYLPAYHIVGSRWKACA